MENDFFEPEENLPEKHDFSENKYRDEILDDLKKKISDVIKRKNIIINKYKEIIFNLTLIDKNLKKEYLNIPEQISTIINDNSEIKMGYEHFLSILKATSYNTTLLFFDNIKLNNQYIFSEQNIKHVIQTSLKLERGFNRFFYGFLNSEIPFQLRDYIEGTCKINIISFLKLLNNLFLNIKEYNGLRNIYSCLYTAYEGLFMIK